MKKLADLVKLHKTCNLLNMCDEFNFIRNAFGYERSFYPSVTESNGNIILTDFNMLNEIFNMFSDIHTVDSVIYKTILDIIITDGIETGVYSAISKNKSWGDYPLNKEKSIQFAIEQLEHKLSSGANLSLYPNIPRKRNYLLKSGFELVMNEDHCYYKIIIDIPTRYKSFRIEVHQIENIVYLSVPTLKETLINTELEKFIFKVDNIEDIKNIVTERFRHRIYYAHYEKECKKLFGNDITYTGMDLSVAGQIIEMNNFK